MSHGCFYRSRLQRNGSQLAISSSVLPAHSETVCRRRGQCSCRKERRSADSSHGRLGRHSLSLREGARLLDDKARHA